MTNEKQASFLPPIVGTKGNEVEDENLANANVSNLNGREDSLAAFNAEAVGIEEEKTPSDQPSSKTSK